MTVEVVVVGSVNLDVSLRMRSLPRPGQTVLATGTERAGGGKGANQAVASARGGAATALVAALGDDAAATLLRQELGGVGVDLTALRTDRASTGTAYVLVDADGENCIVVDSGANAELVELSPAELALVGAAQVLLLQLEVPMATVVQAAAHARQQGVRTVLNAAPAQLLPAELVVDVLVVNEQEALAVAGVGDRLTDAVEALLTRFPEVVVTLGERGAVLATRSAAVQQVPAFEPVQVVDTTGAGDTFCGVLAAAHARGAGAADAVQLACAAASLSVERRGAVPSVPTLERTLARLAEAGRG